MCDKYNLEFYYKLGKKMHNICVRPDKYGKKVVDKLLSDLEMKKLKLGKNDLYDAKQLYENISPAQLTIAKDANLTLQKVLLLCRKSINDDTRQAVLDAALAYVPARISDTFNVAKALNEEGVST